MGSTNPSDYWIWESIIEFKVEKHQFEPNNQMSALIQSLVLPNSSTFDISRVPQELTELKAFHKTFQRYWSLSNKKIKFSSTIVVLNYTMCLNSYIISGNRRELQYKTLCNKFCIAFTSTQFQLYLFRLVVKTGAVIAFN